jgi:hypothetical protein
LKKKARRRRKKKNGTNRVILIKYFVGAFANLRKATVNFAMSVRLSAWNSSAPTRRIYMEFDINYF